MWTVTITESGAIVVKADCTLDRAAATYLRDTLSAAISARVTWPDDEEED